MLLPLLLSYCMQYTRDLQCVLQVPCLSFVLAVSSWPLNSILCFLGSVGWARWREWRAEWWGRLSSNASACWKCMEKVILISFKQLEFIYIYIYIYKLGWIQQLYFLVGWVVLLCCGSYIPLLKDRIFGIVELQLKNLFAKFVFIERHCHCYCKIKKVCIVVNAL